MTFFPLHHVPAHDALLVLVGCCRTTTFASTRFVTSLVLTVCSFALMEPQDITPAHSCTRARERARVLVSPKDRQTVTSTYCKSETRNGVGSTRRLSCDARVSGENVIPNGLTAVFILRSVSRSPMFVVKHEPRSATEELWWINCSYM